MHESDIDYTALNFPESLADRPFVAINMVMSADGRTVIDGTERGLGSPLDQRLMRELRFHFDVVLNGAGTFRASGTSARLRDKRLEDWRRSTGKTPSPIAAVLTRSGNLPAERRFFTDPTFDAVIYLSSSASAEARRTLKSRSRPVVVVPSGREVVAALSHMRQELGAERVLVEGGASLNGEFIRQGLVDEYFLTLAPRIAGGADGLPAVQWPGPTTTAGLQQLELKHAIQADSGELFLRYHVSDSRG